MLIGILSDSHNQYLAVRQAMALFDRLGVSHIIHCGDVGGPSVFEEFIGHRCSFVWGNMDIPDPGTVAFLETIGIRVPTSIPLRLTLDDKSLAVFHGHEPRFRQAIRTLDVDYLLHGHTHAARNERIHGKRIINPGALHRANPTTVATLDTRSDEVTFYEVRMA